MRVLFDNDVVLDLLLDREPFVEDAAALFELHERGRLDAHVSGITVVNVFYVTRKLRGVEAARRAVRELLAALSVYPIDQSILENARGLAFSDYEDAVQHASAEAGRLDAIVTRNLTDFEGATLPVFAPADLLNQLKSPSKTPSP